MSTVLLVTPLVLVTHKRPFESIFPLDSNQFSHAASVQIVNAARRSYFCVFVTHRDVYLCLRAGSDPNIRAASEASLSTYIEKDMLPVCLLVCTTSLSTVLMSFLWCYALISPLPALSISALLNKALFPFHTSAVSVKLSSIDCEKS